MSSIVCHTAWVRFVSGKKPAENNYLKKMRLLRFLLYKFLCWFNPAPHPFCECCVQSNEAPFVRLVWAAVRNLSYLEGLFQPQRLLRDLGAEKYRVQRSSNYLWELMRGNELICDTCKLETQLQRAQRGLGHPAACNTDVLIWEEVSCWLWRTWLCTEPCFWLKWDSFEKESKSW